MTKKIGKLLTEEKDKYSPGKCVRTIGIKGWKIVSVVGIVANFGFLIWILVLTMLWFIKRNHEIQESHVDSYCVPIGVNIPEGCEHTSRLDRANICCSNVTLEEKIQQRADVSYNQQKVPYQSNIFMHHCENHSQKMLPAARVVGPATGFKSSILEWNEKSNNSFLIDVRYIYGRFIIEKSGVYFVYSQVTFLEQSVRMASSLHPLQHTVLRQRRSEHHADMVLQDILSACKLQTGTSNSSSFVGAAFQLHKGDEIMVQVNDHLSVAKSDISNFFGLHMI